MALAYDQSSPRIYTFSLTIVYILGTRRQRGRKICARQRKLIDTFVLIEMRISYEKMMITMRKEFILKFNAIATFVNLLCLFDSVGKDDNEDELAK